jgi:hypothetical protein
LLIGRLLSMRIHGANRKFVEQQVRDHRAEAEADCKKAAEAAKRGRLMTMDVEGAALLEEIYAFIKRFVLLSEAQSTVAALWTVHTHAFEAADCTPYMSVTSPEKRSGKSRLLETLRTIVANPWKTEQASVAAIFRKIDSESLTLLLDESDAAFKGSEEYSEALRCILNSGHERSGKVTRCVGKDFLCQDFSTFSPKAIAGIGKLPDTVADRSIPFNLKRKTRDEKVERFRLRNVKAEAKRLREQLEAWAAQHIEELRDARPELPESLTDRQQDGAEPLLAIADLAGGAWPEAARRALVELCCGAQAADDSVGTRLLSDIRQILTDRGVDRISSADLARVLVEIETSPWGDWKNSKPLTPNGVAHLLKPFGISPHPVRDRTAVFRGYETNDFEDAWTRYLTQDGTPAGPSPAPGNVTPLQPAPSAASSDFQAVTPGNGVTPQNVEKPTSDGPCNGVTLSGPSTGGRGKGGTHGKPQKSILVPGTEPTLFTPQASPETDTTDDEDGEIRL